MTKEGCRSTLEGLGRDLSIRLTSYLDPYSMAQLGRTSSQFGLSRTGDRQRSLVNEAAHRRLSAASEAERSRLLRSGVDESTPVCRMTRAPELKRDGRMCFGADGSTTREAASRRPGLSSLLALPSVAPLLTPPRFFFASSVSLIARGFLSREVQTRLRVPRSLPNILIVCSKCVFTLFIL